MTSAEEEEEGWRLYFRLQEISIFFLVSHRKTTGHEHVHVLELQTEKLHTLGFWAGLEQSPPTCPDP